VSEDERTVRLRLRDDLSDMFTAGRRFFEGLDAVTGEQLHDEMAQLADARGWALGNSHSGHLVGEFPHQNFDSDRLESMITPGNTKPMRRTDPSGRVAHWILEQLLTLA
jgi:hypothetical protein